VVRHQASLHQGVADEVLGAELREVLRGLVEKALQRRRRKKLHAHEAIQKVARPRRYFCCIAGEAARIDLVSPWRLAENVEGGFIRAGQPPQVPRRGIRFVSWQLTGPLRERSGEASSLRAGDNDLG